MVKEFSNTSRVLLNNVAVHLVDSADLTHAM